MKKAIYRTIIEDLQEAINRGDFKPGDRVWSVREIEERYHVSHITALKVYRELAAEEVIVRHSGAGYFVPTQEMLSRNHILIAAFRPLSEYNEYDNFGNRIITGMMRRCIQRGFALYVPSAALSLSGRVPTESEVERMAAEISAFRKPSGIIFDMRYSDKMLEKYLLPACGTTPAILLGRMSAMPLKTVSPPISECGCEAALLALKTNAERFIICPSEDRPDEELLIRAFQRKLAEGNIPPEKIVCIKAKYSAWDFASNIQLVRNLADSIDKKCKPFLFSLNDFLGRRLCSELIARNFQPGKDFSLLSFGGFELVRTSSPKLTCIALSPEEMGATAVEALVENSGQARKEYYTSYRIELNETF